MLPVFPRVVCAEPRLLELCKRVVAQYTECCRLPAVVKPHVFKAGVRHLGTGFVAHAMSSLVLEAVEPALHEGRPSETLRFIEQIMPK